MKAVSLILLPLLFSLVLTIPTLAYEAVTLNVTYTNTGYSGGSWLRCTNLTGQVYCYSLIEYATGTHDLKVLRFNSTGGTTTCDTGWGSSIYAIRGMTIINTTHIGFNDEYNSLCVVDVSNMTASSDCSANKACPLYTGVKIPNTNIEGGFYNISSNASGWVYWGDGIYVKNSTTGANITITTLNDTIANYDITSLTLPNQSDNSTLYATDKYFNYIYQLQSGSVSKRFENISQLYGVNSLYPQWDMLYVNSTTMWIYFIGGNSNGRFYSANFMDIVANASLGETCNYINETLGTVCDALDSSHRGYITNKNNCNVTTAQCPSGSQCVPYTPQYFAKNQLYEDIASCDGCYWFQLYNLSSGAWYTTRSNCWNTQDVCLQASSPAWTGIGFRIVTGRGTAYYNQTIPSGVTTNFTKYTIYCQNLTNSGMVYVVDENGVSNLTETQYIYNETGIDITSNPAVSCPNTATTCYDSNCNIVPCYTGQDSTQSLKSGINSMMGSPYGADIISLFVSAGISILIFLESKDRNINLLLGVFLLCASIFSFIGLLVWWFIVLEAGMIFVLIFWKTAG